MVHRATAELEKSPKMKSAFKVKSTNPTSSSTNQIVQLSCRFAFHRSSWKVLREFVNTLVTGRSGQPVTLWLKCTVTCKYKEKKTNKWIITKRHGNICRTDVQHTLEHYKTLNLEAQCEQELSPCIQKHISITLFWTMERQFLLIFFPVSM